MVKDPWHSIPFPIKFELDSESAKKKGTYKGRTVLWNTGLSRIDTGNGSYEPSYVSKVRIDTKVYE